MRGPDSSPGKVLKAQKSSLLPESFFFPDFAEFFVKVVFNLKLNEEKSKVTSFCPRESLLPPAGCSGYLRPLQINIVKMLRLFPLTSFILLDFYQFS